MVPQTTVGIVIPRAVAEEVAAAQVRRIDSYTPFVTTAEPACSSEAEDGEYGEEWCPFHHHSLELVSSHDDAHADRTDVSLTYAAGRRIPHPSAELGEAQPRLAIVVTSSEEEKGEGGTRSICLSVGYWGRWLHTPQEWHRKRQASQAVANMIGSAFGMVSLAITIAAAAALVVAAALRGVDKPVTEWDHLCKWLHPLTHMLAVAGAQVLAGRWWCCGRCAVVEPLARPRAHHVNRRAKADAAPVPPR